MAVAFKRLPAVTFGGMLIRPQSSAGPCRGTGEKPGTLATPGPHPLHPRAPLPFTPSSCSPSSSLDSLGQSERKINIPLDVLLITTHLNLLQPVLPSLHCSSSHPPPSLTVSTGNKCSQHAPLSSHPEPQTPKMTLTPPSAERTHLRHSGRCEDEPELTTPFSGIIVLLGSLKQGERDHRRAVSVGQSM